MLQILRNKQFVWRYMLAILILLCVTVKANAQSGPADQIIELKDKVQILVDGGVLSESTGDYLCRKLQRAINKLNINVKLSIDSLNEFSKKTRYLINTSRLSCQDGAPLIECSNAIIVLLGGTPKHQVPDKCP